jgi:hypothetical protein
MRAERLVTAAMKLDAREILLSPCSSGNAIIEPDFKKEAYKRFNT